MEDTEAVWTFHRTYFFISFSSLSIIFRPGIMASARDLPPTSGGGVSPYAESAKRLPLNVPIGCGTYGFVRLHT